jgi:hypothetical protein
MTVSRRVVFLVGGYDPKQPDAFFGRLAKELQRSAATCGFTAAVAPVAVSPEREIGSVEIDTVGPDWRAGTYFGFLVLDPIVLKDFARPLHRRVFRYLATWLDYFGSGTFLAMARKAWRFSLYFLYPFVVLLFFAALAAALGLAAASIPIPYAAAVGSVVALAAFVLLLHTLGNRWSVLLLMDLWSFSLRFLRGRRPDAEALLDRFAAAIVEKARTADADELILVGHSTGGGLILDIAARCIALDPGFSGRSRRTSILTLGSTAQKLGMHPAASAFRARVKSLVDDPYLAWVDVQCLTDIINFYKSDPVADMGLQPRVKHEPIEAPFPLTLAVRVKEMLEPATYKRIKRNFFRVHYQYIFGNTRRYFYDFFLICCGPQPLAERMLEGTGRKPAVREAA